MSLEALLRQLGEHAGWENTSGAVAAALAIVALPGDEPIRALLLRLERCDSVDLTDDAGDVGDELYRLRHAIEEGLVAGGANVDRLARPLIRVDRAASFDLVLARVCARRRDQTLFPVLEEWMRGTHELQQSAMDCLGHLGDRRGLALVHRALSSPPELNRHWFLRLAAGALARLCDAAGLEALFADHDAYVRWSVIDAAQHLSDPEARERLRRRARDDVDANVRKAAKRE